jgi:hypothetical protein
MASKTFKIVWEIELAAETPKEAAIEAQRWMKAEGNDWQYFVQETGKDKPIFSIDLQEQTEEEINKATYKPTIY